MHVDERCTEIDTIIKKWYYEYKEEIEILAKILKVRLSDKGDTKILLQIISSNLADDPNITSIDQSIKENTKTIVLGV